MFHVFHVTIPGPSQELSGKFLLTTTNSTCRTRSSSSSICRAARGILTPLSSSLAKKSCDVDEGMGLKVGTDEW